MKKVSHWSRGLRTKRLEFLWICDFHLNPRSLAKKSHNAWGLGYLNVTDIREMHHLPVFLWRCAASVLGGCKCERVPLRSSLVRYLRVVDLSKSSILVTIVPLALLSRQSQGETNIVTCTDIQNEMIKWPWSPNPWITPDTHADRFVPEWCRVSCRICVLPASPSSRVPVYLRATKLEKEAHRSPRAYFKPSGRFPALFKASFMSARQCPPRNFLHGELVLENKPR